MSAIEWNLFKTWMENGEYAKTEAALLALVPGDSDEERRRIHYLARLDGLQGRDSRVIEALARFQDRANSNFLVRIEYAAAQYRLGNTVAWEKCVSELSKDFENFASVLSLESRMNGVRFLSQAHEELGRIPLALSVLQRGRSWCEDQPGSKYQMFILNELVRVHASYGISENLSNYYRQLSAFRASLHTRLFERERAHALLLAEIELFGWEGAKERFSGLIRDPKLTEQFFALISFDSYEALLRRGDEIPSEISEAVHRASASCAFEEILKSASSERWGTYLKLRDQIPVASRLRLLSIFKTNEARRESMFLRSSFDKETSLFWDTILGPEPITLVLSENSIQSETMTIGLEKKRASRDLLRALAKRRSFLNEALIREIWDEVSAPQHTDRLRILVSRTNRLLSRIGVGPRAIEFTKRDVRLRTGLCLTYSNEQFHSGS